MFPFSSRSNSGSRIWRSSTWISSGCAVTWPVFRAESYPTLKAFWPLPAVQQNPHWGAWGSSLCPPSMHWWGTPGKPDHNTKGKSIESRCSDWTERPLRCCVSWSDLFQRRSHTPEALVVPDLQAAQEKSVYLTERPGQPDEARAGEETLGITGTSPLFTSNICSGETQHGEKEALPVLLFVVKHRTVLLPQV